MASLAALITAAIIKVSQTNPALDREGEPTADEVRKDFTDALLIELGLAPIPVAAHAPVSEPEKKKAAPKKRAAKKEEDADVVALTAAVAELAVEPKPKKAKEEVASAPAPVAGSNAGAGAPPVVAEAAPKKKPGPKPKAVKAEGPANVDKLTPTHKKHIKKIAEELKVETRDKEFLAYANEMSAEEWSGKSLDDHIRAFLTPVPPPLAPAPTEFVLVEFKGKEYLVDPKTKFVYANSDDPDSVIRERDHIGAMGMLEYAQMKLPA